MRWAWLSLAVFAIDAALVAKGVTRAIDLRILTALRPADLPSVAIFPAWTVQAAIALTMLGAWIVRVPVAMLGALALSIAGRRREAIILVGAVASGALGLFVLKFLFHRPRPDLLWRLIVERDTSFPSGHAMGSTILYPLLGLLLGRLASPATARAGLALGLVMAVTIGLTRILLGVHWTSDVIGGWAIGGAWMLAAVALIPRRR